MVVDFLKQAFENQYGSIDDDAVLKITGASDKPRKLIRKFKNEKLPCVAVTVDLLTTGIDVPEIVNIVFLRRVKSRILFEQMKGRGTRLCDAINKEIFRIFDAVDLYAALEPYSTMKPVVVNPKITFEQLAEELAQNNDKDHIQEIKSQILAKLQRKRRLITTQEYIEKFKILAGDDFSGLVSSIKKMEDTEFKKWFADHENLPGFLDKVRSKIKEMIK